MANYLEVIHLSKSFTLGKESVLVLDNIQFSVDSGELICILGPSGCGKTTLLRIIAGLEKQTSGQILLNGQSLKSTSRERGMVFQEPRLFPWLTLEKNVAFGIKGTLEKSQLNNTVRNLLIMMRLEKFAKALPHQLSGGMAQRGAIARALAVNPQILLLDEPFAALDTSTRSRLQSDLLNLWQSTHKTCIHVTHNIEEALTLGQRIIVIQASPGRLQTILPIPLSYPRCADDPDFIALKETLKSLLART